MMPNAIQIRSAVFPQCTGQTDRRTHRQNDARTHRPTDRPRESLIAIGRCATRATRPNNNNNVTNLNRSVSCKRCSARKYLRYFFSTKTEQTDDRDVEVGVYKAVGMSNIIATIISRCDACPFRRDKCDAAHTMNSASGDCLSSRLVYDMHLTLSATCAMPRKLSGISGESPNGIDRCPARLLLGGRRDKHRMHVYRLGRISLRSCRWPWSSAVRMSFSRPE